MRNFIAPETASAASETTVNCALMLLLASTPVCKTTNSASLLEIEKAFSAPAVDVKKASEIKDNSDSKDKTIAEKDREKLDKKFSKKKEENKKK